jgi:anaerobic ribonucleoside-triphosphate reductase activating protein
MTDALNVAQICPETYALGPGKRFVVWVQGCPFDCAGCIAPDWIPIREAQIVPVRELVERILATEDLEGITISGGEPMLQADCLARLLSEVRTVRPDLSAIAFSGFKLEQLKRKAITDPGIARLLGQLDVLIDGLYRQEHDDGRGLRGSLNQRTHFLTDRYKHLTEEFENGNRDLEIHLLSDGLLLVGLPTQGAMRTMHSIVNRLEPPGVARSKRRVLSRDGKD